MENWIGCDIATINLRRLKVKVPRLVQHWEVYGDTSRWPLHFRKVHRRSDAARERPRRSVLTSLVVMAAIMIYAARDHGAAR
jgi:hypothetical protein